MRCVLCQNLETAFRDRWVEYTNANLSFYGANNQSAAYLMVEMERARMELDEHRAVCIFIERPVPAAMQRPAQLAVASRGSIPSAA